MKKIFLFLFISLIISSNSTSPISWLFSSSKPENKFSTKFKISTKFLLFTYFDNLKKGKSSNQTIYPKDDVCIVFKAENTKDNYYILETTMQSFPKTEKNSDLKNILLEKVKLRYTDEDQIKNDMPSTNENGIAVVKKGPFTSYYHKDKNHHIATDFTNLYRDGSSSTSICEKCRAKPSYQCSFSYRTLVSEEKFNKFYLEWQEREKDKQSN